MEEKTIFAPPAAQGSLRRGVRLNGLYEVGPLIAHGGMGEVYRGFNIVTNDPVAIKMILPELSSNPDVFALFRREASTLHNLQHEAIVRYYVFSVDPDLQRAYLAMEFVDGPSLSKSVSDRPMAVEDVKILQRRLASALHTAHQAGVVHRDISSDNVILQDGDPRRAKIVDFGIARSARAQEGTIIGGGFAGKYNYASPEQLGLAGGEVTPKSDIYSLGLVLAEALRGRPLDMNGSQAEIIEKRRRVPDLSDIPVSMRPLIAQMLQPLPMDRPESMAAVAAWSPGGSRGRQAADGGDRKSSTLGRVAAAAAVLILIGSVGATVYVFRDAIPLPKLASAPAPPQSPAQPPGPNSGPNSPPKLPPLPTDNPPSRPESGQTGSQPTSPPVVATAPPQPPAHPPTADELVDALKKARAQRQQSTVVASNQPAGEAPSSSPSSPITPATPPPAASSSSAQEPSDHPAVNPSPPPPHPHAETPPNAPVTANPAKPPMPPSAPNASEPRPSEPAKPVASTPHLTADDIIAALERERARAKTSAVSSPPPAPEPAPSAKPTTEASVLDSQPPAPEVKKNDVTQKPPPAEPGPPLAQKPVEAPAPPTPPPPSNQAGPAEKPAGNLAGPPAAEVAALGNRPADNIPEPQKNDAPAVPPPPTEEPKPSHEPPPLPPPTAQTPATLAPLAKPPAATPSENPKTDVVASKPADAGAGAIDDRPPAVTPEPQKNDVAAPHAAQSLVTLGGAVVGQDFAADLPPFSDTGDVKSLRLRAEPQPPAGLAFVDLGSGFARLAGKPKEAGAYSFDIVASDAGAASARVMVKIAIAPAAAPAPDDRSKLAAVEPTDKAAEFLRTFDGGSCFVARSIGAKGSTPVILGVGADKRAFQRFYENFNQTVGVQPSLTVRLIASSQCPAITLIGEGVHGEGNAPKIELSNFDVGRNKPLAGLVSNISGRSLALLLVSSDGQVHRIETQPRGNGASAAFSVPISGSGADTVVMQVVIAVVSQEPLPALAGFRSGAATDILPRIQSDLAAAHGELEAEFFRFVN